MITLKDIGKTYSLGRDSSVQAVRGVSLAIERGEFIVITGRSGSGKTTLLNLAAGLTRPTSGTVEIDGVNLWSLPDGEQSLLRNQKIGFVFQFPSLLPSLTALENVVLPTVFGGNSRSAGGQRDAYDRASRLLEQVGLAEKQASYPRQLSAGQQQRVVVARALINRPEILMADEPTSDLDERTEEEIMDLFAEIHKTSGITVLLVTHTSQLVRYGTRAVQMAGGRLVESDVAAGDNAGHERRLT